GLAGSARHDATRAARCHAVSCLPVSTMFPEGKRTCKPGFVSPSAEAEDGMAIPLGRALLRASSDLPGNPAAPRGAASDEPPLRLPYLVLHRMGFAVPSMLPPTR